MYVVAVTVFVKGENVERFIAAALDNATHTRRESGNVRFDVLQHEEDPARFLLYEVYREKDDFARHQQTEHYLRFKTTVADWMAKPREGAKHHPLFFDNAPIA